MNNVELKKIILEEMYKILNEADEPYISGQEMTDDEKEAATFKAKNDYHNNQTLATIVGWLQQLTPVKYRQLLEDVLKIYPNASRESNSIGSVIYNKIKGLIDEWSIKKQKFNNLQRSSDVIHLATGAYGKNIQKALNRSGLIV